MELAALLNGSRPLLIGVVHLAPTPGAPRAGAVEELLARAEADARAWLAGASPKFSTRSASA
ncbi:MAG: hypothetical protein ABL998_21190, partial [Planctomycetota bacterium]